MAKLYPPYIEGTLPSFCEDVNENREKVKILKVPFTMNKTVGIGTVWGFAIRIKTVSTNQLIYTDRIRLGQNGNYSIPEYIEFNIQDSKLIRPTKKLLIGSYYKVQIAYVDKENEEVGYFSTVGVVKYTSKPTMRIENMIAETLHSDFGAYTGIYTNSDSTEKLYSYCFEIYDNHNNLIKTSGELLHNHETDVEIDTTTDFYEPALNLEENKTYKIIYKGTTTNGMQVESPYYKIIQQSTIPPEIDASLEVIMNKDNGYVQIVVQGNTDPTTQLEKNAIGTFQILRATELAGFADWQVIHRFVLFGSPPSQVDIKDFTIEQGKKYQYALQQYNNKTHLVSDKIFSSVVLCDFEDCFLYDGKRQLKIKYNPKVSSFKQTLQEAKTVTLGQQFPFILRSGKTNYKEFPISGLISYHMDEENLFIKDEELGLQTDTYNLTRKRTLRTGVNSYSTDYFDDLQETYGTAEMERIYGYYLERDVSNSEENQIAEQLTRTTNLLDYNIAAERIFKLKVLEFLNDGKPKLFRSPGEGNYIVRLMNSSLTPNDQLGRMLHNFSTTATEVETFGSKALEAAGIINTAEVDTKQLRWETIMLADLQNKESDAEGWIQVNNYPAASIQCQDMVPDSRVRISFKNDHTVEIAIGVTGAYFSNTDQEIEKIEINKSLFNTSYQGQITYGFYGTTFNHFDTYEKFEINDIPVTQFIGEQILNEQKVGIKEALTDVRNVVTNFNLLHFVKREIVPVYKYGNDFYTAEQSNAYVNNPPNNETLIELADYSDIVGTEKILWAPSAPDKRYNWYTIYPNTDTVPRGIINIRAVIPTNCVSTDIYYRTNKQERGSIVTINAKSNNWFIMESGDEYIVEIKLRLPQLGKKEVRGGYIIYETLPMFEADNLNLEQRIAIEQCDPLCVYKVVNNAVFNNGVFSEELYFDGNSKNYIYYSNEIQLDDKVVDISVTKEYQATVPEDINEVYIPSGVIADVGVQRRTITYGIETDDNYSNIQQAKRNWKAAQDALHNIIFTENWIDNYSERLQEAEQKEQDKYAIYLDILKTELDILAGEGQ